MHTEFQTRRARGRLSREDQRRLGDVLQRAYDEVLKQGVPDRFKDLIEQLDRNERIPEADEDADDERHSGALRSGSEQGVHAKGSDKSKDPN